MTMIKKILAGLLALLTAAVAFATEVNTATQAELDAVKGIGPALSARIVDARKTGPFKDWGDLVTRVKGVGEKNSAEFSAGGLTVNGAAMAGAPAGATLPRKTGSKGTAATASTAAAPVPATSTSPAATPPATSTTSSATTPAAARTAAPASAPMTAADKKAARKAAKEEKAQEKARMKAASGATGAASTSAASAPARK